MDEYGLHDDGSRKFDTPPWVPSNKRRCVGANICPALEGQAGAMALAKLLRVDHVFIQQPRASVIAAQILEGKNPTNRRKQYLVRHLLSFAYDYTLHREIYRRVLISALVFLRPMIQDLDLKKRIDMAVVEEVLQDL